MLHDRVSLRPGHRDIGGSAQTSDGPSEPERGLPAEDWFHEGVRREEEQEVCGGFYARREIATNNKIL